MNITKEELKELGASAENSAKYVDALNLTCDKFQINTRARVCAFLAQIYAESGCLAKTKEDPPHYRVEKLMEIWPRQFPTVEIAQKYAMGKDIDGWFALTYDVNKSLGNYLPGDGKKFIGRGLKQLTGRFNVTECGKALGVKFEDNPALLEQLPYSALSAGWFWNWKGLNALADLDTVDSVRLITKKVQGGDGNLIQRIAFWTKAKSIFKNHVFESEVGKEKKLKELEKIIITPTEKVANIRVDDENFK